MRVFGGSLLRPYDHLARLERSARTLGLELPLAVPELLGVIREVVTRSGLEDAHVRPIVTRGFGAPGLDHWRCEKPSLIVTAYPFPPMLGTDPLRLLIGSVVRKAPRSLGAHVKSLDYLDAIVAKQQAKAAGLDDTVMLDQLGAVAECTSTNLFLVADGVLVTPTTRAALPGITRRTVLELAEELRIPVEGGRVADGAVRRRGGVPDRVGRRHRRCRLDRRARNCDARSPLLRRPQGGLRRPDARQSPSRPDRGAPKGGFPYRSHSAVT